MITIYRVQHLVDGRGPFRPGFSKEWIDPDPKMKDIARLPSPEKDPGLPEFEQIYQRFKAAVAMGCHCGFGCRSLEWILKWFTGTELKNLGRLGYRTVATEVFVIAESECQIAFVRPWPLHMQVRVVNPYAKPTPSPTGRQSRQKAV